MITGITQENMVYVDGKPLDLEASRKVVDHSPTGFQWGYLGSGPSQLALALLLHFGASVDEALAWYDEFKREIIATLKHGEDFEMDDSRVKDWLEARRLFSRNFEDETKNC
jgi:hypothetical protein